MDGKRTLLARRENYRIALARCLRNKAHKDRASIEAYQKLLGDVELKLDTYRVRSTHPLQ